MQQTAFSTRTQSDGGFQQNGLNLGNALDYISLLNLILINENSKYQPISDFSPRERITENEYISLNFLG